MSHMNELSAWAEDRGLEQVPAEQLFEMRRRERALIAMSRPEYIDSEKTRKERYESNS